MTLRLEPFQPPFEAALLNLVLSPEPLAFTAHPRDLLTQVQADPDRLAVALLDGERPVGLFALSVGAHCDK